MLQPIQLPAINGEPWTTMDEPPTLLLLQQPNTQEFAPLGKRIAVLLMQQSELPTRQANEQLLTSEAPPPTRAHIAAAKAQAEIYAARETLHNTRGIPDLMRTQLNNELDAIETWLIRNLNQMTSAQDHWSRSEFAEQILKEGFALGYSTTLDSQLTTVATWDFWDGEMPGGGPGATILDPRSSL